MPGRNCWSHLPSNVDADVGRTREGRPTQRPQETAFRAWFIDWFRKNVWTDPTTRASKEPALHRVLEQHTGGDLFEVADAHVPDDLKRFFYMDYHREYDGWSYATALPNRRMRNFEDGGQPDSPSLDNPTEDMGRRVD